MSAAELFEVAWVVADRSGLVSKAMDLLRRKNRLILLGSTGVGKSQFTQSISKNSFVAIHADDRTGYAHTVPFEINGNLFHARDVPGEKAHEQVRRTEMQNFVKQSGSKGIVNFVSFGYHEYEEAADIAFHGNRVRESFLQDHREREINLLAEWAALVGPEWVLTVVTKADIWWDKKDQVIDYYKNGKYAEKIKKIVPSGLHSVAPYSSVTHRFFDRISVSGGFDDAMRIKLRNGVLKAMCEAVDRGSLQ